MTSAAQPIDRIMLAAQAATIFTRTHRLAYAHIGPDLTITHVSPDFEQLADDPAAPLEGQPLLDCLWAFVGSEDDLQAVLRDDLNEVVLEQINRQRPDGSIAYLTYRVTRLAADRAAGLLLVVEDVTEASQLQQHVTQDRNELRLVQAQLNRANAELQRLNRFKSFVLSMAAHDLRSPLTVMLGYADLLLKALDRGLPPSRDDLATILAQANRLNQMISNLLNLDQIERGQLVVRPVECSLHDLVRDVIELVSAMAAMKALTFTADLPLNPIVIWADPDRVRQILQNVIGNAVKYTPDGGAVQIQARSDDRQAIVQVSDTGPGLTPEQIAHLFQPYYRTDEARDSQIEGSGLGLFIVKTLVDAQHGDISVESEVEHGTTFSVRLPLASAQNGQ